ncbi:unnamed protein product, partial [marine sediment metagenome]
VCSISGLCAFKGKISVNAICKRLGISMSTIQVQVRRKILKHFKVDGFVSLVRSADLLERILERLGLLERQDPNVKDDTEESDIVEITLGNAVQVFNSHNLLDYYCFAIRGWEHSQINICLKFNQNPLDYNLAKLSKTTPLPNYSILNGVLITGSIEDVYWPDLSYFRIKAGEVILITSHYCVTVRFFPGSSQNSKLRLNWHWSSHGVTATVSVYYDEDFLPHVHEVDEWDHEIELIPNWHIGNITIQVVEPWFIPTEDKYLYIDFLTFYPTE